MQIKNLEASATDTSKEIIVVLPLIKEVVFTNFVEGNYK